MRKKPTRSFSQTGRSASLSTQTTRVRSRRPSPPTTTSAPAGFVPPDPSLELEAEIKRKKTRARIYAVSAVFALPAITFGVYWAWQHVRLGLAGGLVLAIVMLQRTTRRALAGRGANK